jgi:hypothetical protein
MRTSALAQLLQCLGQGSPAHLLQCLPSLDLVVVLVVGMATHAVGVPVSGQDGGEGGSSTEHEGKTAPWLLLALDDRRSRAETYWQLRQQHRRRIQQWPRCSSHPSGAGCWLRRV